MADRIDIEELYGELRRLVRSLSVSRTLSRDDLEDVVQFAVYRIVVEGVLGRARNRQAFMKALVYNRIISELRRRGRIDSREDLDTLEGHHDDEGSSLPESWAPGRIDAIRRQLECVAQDAIARRPARYRAIGRATWAQISRLAFDGATFDEILTEAGMTDASSPEEILTLKNSIYQRQFRFKGVEMEKAIEAAADAGTITLAEKAFRLRCLAWLDRNGARRPSRP